MAPTPFADMVMMYSTTSGFVKCPVGTRPGGAFAPALGELYLGPIENMDQTCKIQLVATTSLHS